MKRLVFHILAILVFGLTLFLPSGEAEMNSLTDEEMGALLLNMWNFSLSIRLAPQINAVKKGDLSDEAEEKEALRIENNALRIEDSGRDDAIRERLATEGPEQVYRTNLDVEGNSIRVGKEIHLNSRKVTYTSR